MVKNVESHPNKSKPPSVFHYNTLKIFVSIIYEKFSGKFSGRLPRGVFNQLSDSNFEKENYVSGKY